jgi:hypothetical protein
MSEKHGPDEDCPACYECPGCGGGDGSEPRRPYLDRTRPGVVVLMCSDCRGAAILCPNYDPEMTP